MIRFFDIIFSLLGIMLTSPILLLIYLIGTFDTGSALFYQKRMGKYQKPFTLIKFRSMSQDAISVPTHLVESSKITNFGLFLRKTKLDELPQLWNVLVGDMSIVGPRPGLCDHEELILIRAKYQIFDVRPGITGLAQVENIDMSTPMLLVEKDAKMIAEFSIYIYFKFIFKTIIGNGRGDRIKN
jgi:lipopolysaccharide/colanic/teichoic acid biosynthesis glycosyltransferase